MAQTNRIESFWSLMKRGVTGIHHWVSVKHLPAYVDEFATRSNLRKGGTLEFMCFIANSMSGKQLSYSQLKSRGQSNGSGARYLTLRKVNKRIKLFIDVDSVLLDYVSAFTKYMAVNHPAINYDPMDYFPRKYLDHFQNSEYFASLKPVAGAVAGIKCLREQPVDIRLVTCSMSGGPLQETRRRYNLSRVFDSKLLDGAVFLPYGASKIDWLKSEYEVEGEEWRYVLIDDHPKHIADWVNAKCHGILLNTTEWDSEKWPIVEQSVVAANWPMVIEMFAHYVKSSH